MNYFYCMEMNCNDIIVEKGRIFCENHTKYNVYQLKPCIKRVEKTIIREKILNEIDDFILFN